MKRDDVEEPCEEGGEAPCLAHLFEDPDDEPTPDHPEAMPLTDERRRQ